MLYVDKTFKRSARAGRRGLRGVAAIAIRLAVRPHLIAVAAISLAALAAIAAFAQTPAPVTLSGLFDPDLADIRPDAIGKLQEAAKKAHRDCYPPRVKFTVVTQNVGYRLFVESLAHARQKALEQALPSLGLEPGQFKVDYVIGLVDGVLVSYDKFKPEDDKDREAPKLKVTSTPKKGSKVKAGDKIKVTITASERYEDGHKSWPTGVQQIQLVADDGRVDGKEYGRVPDPCERRTFEVTYTVPRNPPRIVHLRAVADDGSTNDSEVAEFPTAGDWHGSLDWSAHQMAAGPQDWSGHADLVLDDDGRGGLTGTLTGTQKQTLRLPHCTADTTGTINARLTGTVTLSAQKITINVMDRQSTWPETTSCAEGGSAGTGGVVFDWPQFDEALRGLAPSADGSSYQYHHEFTIRGGTARFTLILRRALPR